jgi:uncharacterized protein YbbK (DUF523 family)
MSSITLISACLLGVRCRWDGAVLPPVNDLDKSTLYIPVCPEQLGGLPTPRPPCQIVGGKDVNVLSRKVKVVEVESGFDRTENFQRGAEETLRIARLSGATRALFKQRSPSCGCGEIYHGEQIVTGNGVTTDLLLEAGIKVEPR